jgi:hypothetical protein
MEKLEDNNETDLCEDINLFELKKRIEAAFGKSPEFWKDMEKDDDVIIMADDIPFKPVQMAASLNAEGDIVADAEPFVDFVIRTFRKPLDVNPEAEKEKAQIDAERAKRPLFNNFRPSQVKMSSLSYRVSLYEEEEIGQEDPMEWWYLLERIQSFPMTTNPEAEAEKERLDIERRNRPQPTFVPKRICIDHEYKINGQIVYPCELHPYSFTMEDLKSSFTLEDIKSTEVPAQPAEPKAEAPEAKQGWFKRLFGWLRRK